MVSALDFRASSPVGTLAGTIVLCYEDMIDHRSYAHKA